MDQQFLQGRNLLQQVRNVQDETERVTSILEGNGQLGVRAPQMLERLGDGLSLLAQIASCAWGCRETDHTIENLVRRFSNAATAALRLAYLGQYDEAIALIRVMGELANLLQLFAMNSEHLDRWRSVSDKERIAEYGPVGVRLKLEALKATPILDHKSYNKLCELGVHVTPASAFTSHDIEGTRVYVGSQLSVPAFLMVLSELVYLTAQVLPHCGEITGREEDRLRSLRECRDTLLKTLSWLRVTNYERVMAHFRKGQQPP
jgi:hypothetical protein